MIIEIDLESSTPIYEQLIWEIKKGVANKKINSGQEMPSVRELAGDLGINLHTVNKAYKLLEDEGILLRRRNRFVVNEVENFKENGSWREVMDDLLYKIIINGKLLGLSEDDFSALYQENLKKIENKMEDE